MNALDRIAGAWSQFQPPTATGSAAAPPSQSNTPAASGGGFFDGLGGFLSGLSNTAGGLLDSAGDLVGSWNTLEGQVTSPPPRSGEGRPQRGGVLHIPPPTNWTPIIAIVGMGVLATYMVLKK